MAQVEFPLRAAGRNGSNGPNGHHGHHSKRNGHPPAADIGPAVIVDYDGFERLGKELLVERELELWVTEPGEDLTPFHSPIPGWGRLAKRIIDVVGSIGALIVLSPLLIGAAIAIKATSRGPIIYRQTRVGTNGRRFAMHKLRTMKTGNDPSAHEAYVAGLVAGEASSSEGLFKISDDPRVTRVGRFLRKLSIDELPQLYDVLLGTMSLVGPRPPLPRELRYYDARSWQRLRVTPGITGLWQVTGRSTTTHREMVDLDLDYWQNWSLRREFIILAKTPGTVLRGETA